MECCFQLGKESAILLKANYPNKPRGDELEWLSYGCRTGTGIDESHPLDWFTRGRGSGTAIFKAKPVIWDLDRSKEQNKSLVLVPKEVSHEALNVLYGENVFEHQVCGHLEIFFLAIWTLFEMYASPRNGI